MKETIGQQINRERDELIKKSFTKAFTQVTEFVAVTIREYGDGAETTDYNREQFVDGCIEELRQAMLDKVVKMEFK